ncbi:MAG: tRNA-dihydrouridine synthase family protein, partial [Acidobacteria bacterium]|nr:tRNA-dihydrouridine synthase family protein [Acidobacteriota bacterium]
CFGVQLAGTKPEEMAWAAALVEARGADFVDVNLGCPIDHFTRKGLGAAIGRQPRRIHRIVEAMKQALTRVPITVKIRLGWNEESRNYAEQARAAVDGGADAIFVHGRTRNARYRFAADWGAIGEIAASVPVPVIGNGDLLFPHEIRAALERSGCTGVMTARGALIKPWIFREALDGYREVTADERVAVYRRYAALAREHWGDDEHGLERVRIFLAWHLDFWTRYAPRREDGSFPTLQQREGDSQPRPPLDALLARRDAAALTYLADRLMGGEPIDAAEVQPAEHNETAEFVEAEG